MSGLLGSPLGDPVFRKIHMIWERPLMQVFWIMDYYGFLRKATCIGLFADDSDEAELYFLFRATNCHLSS